MVHSLNGLPEVSDLKFSLTLQLDRLSTTHPFFSDYRDWRRLEKDDPQRTYEQLLVKLRYYVAEQREQSHRLQILSGQQPVRVSPSPSANTEGKGKGDHR